MIRTLILLSLFPIASAAQTYIATEVGKPCPPNSVPVMLQDGRWVCAVASTLTPLESPMPENRRENAK
ncbi:MAG TPA: hypothetical protein VHB49_10035 [Bradyrhizobium sp.]|nr:hypothetical protein [Bradyrhizobium sp.]